MRTWFRDMLSTVWFVVKLSLGLLLAVGLLRLFSLPAWESMLSQSIGQFQPVAHLETAVRVTAIFFAVTWGLRLLEKMFGKNRWHSQYGIQPGRRRLGHAFTAPFLHGSEAHLISNTYRFLLYSAISVLLAPTLQAFLIACIVIVLISTLGTWLFGARNSSHAGSSVFIFGFFGFIVAYGLLGPGGWWQRVVALLVTALHAGRTYQVLRYPVASASREGHFWGLIGGLYAARVVYLLSG